MPGGIIHFAFSLSLFIHRRLREFSWSLGSACKSMVIFIPIAISSPPRRRSNIMQSDSRCILFPAWLVPGWWVVKAAWLALLLLSPGWWLCLRLWFKWWWLIIWLRIEGIPITWHSPCCVRPPPGESNQTENEKDENADQNSCIDAI